MGLLDVRLGMSSAYHAETDGQAEKINHVVMTYLRAFARKSPDSWHKLLPTAEFAYNSSVHSATGKTPFELDLGYTPRTPLDTLLRKTQGSRNSSNEEAVSFAERQRYNLELA
jgi:hypothetical protein